MPLSWVGCVLTRLYGASLLITLGRKSNSIVSTIKKEIKDYQTFNPSEEEAKTILQQMHTIVDLTEKQLGLLVQGKAQFEKLHVGGWSRECNIKSLLANHFQVSSRRT
jgi:hypothetical protein